MCLIVQRPCIEHPRLLVLPREGWPTQVGVFCRQFQGPLWLVAGNMLRDVFVLEWEQSTQTTRYHQIGHPKCWLGMITRTGVPLMIMYVLWSGIVRPIHLI